VINELSLHLHGETVENRNITQPAEIRTEHVSSKHQECYRYPNSSGHYLCSSVNFTGVCKQWTVRWGEHEALMVKIKNGHRAKSEDMNRSDLLRECFVTLL
jgi:hypothetical protein